MKALLAIGLLFTGTTLLADEPKKLTMEDLQSTWLFDSASRTNSKDSLAVVWNAKLVVNGKAIVIEKFLGLKNPLKGTIELDPAGKTSHLDLTLEEFDLKGIAPLKITAGTLAGVYQRDGQHLRFCFHSEPGGARPKTVEDAGKKLFSFSLVKAPKDFAEFPREILVKVTTPDGKPAKGVSLGTSMSKPRNAKTFESEGKWSLEEPKRVDDKGRLKITYAEERFQAQCVIAWDEVNRLMGFGSMTPASVAYKPEVTIELKSVCNVKLNTTCDALKKSCQTDYFGCYAITKAGHWIASNSNKSGQLDFLLPAGDYTLFFYGSEYLGSKHHPLTVPKDCSEYTAPEIQLPPNGLLKLLGKPAPVLTDVVAWKGEAVKIADLKGKVVLLEFWGYWCGPCIRSMPVQFELHEKFADKGLAIIGVHVDADGEIDSAAKLDEKLASYKRDV